MRRPGRWLPLLLLVLAVGLAVAARGTGGADSPEHRSDSDAANGTSALRRLAEVLGHPAGDLSAGFQPDLGTRVLFIFTPNQGFTAGETRRATDYVAGGGTLVYAAERGDPRLDLALGVLRTRGLGSGDGTGTGPALAGVGHLSGGAGVAPLRAGPGQAVLARNPRGDPLLLEEFRGGGRVITLADPLELCNGYLERADNRRLASDLLGLAVGGGAVAFDELHHEAGGPASPLTGWLSTVWGAAITWGALLLGAGLFLRGRGFGPRLVLPGGGDRGSAEYVAAVGGLLRRSGAARLTAALLQAATRRAVAARHGLHATATAFPDHLAQRSPAEAASLAEAERLAGEVRREPDLLAAAARLHKLAHPAPNPAAGNPAAMR